MMRRRAFAVPSGLVAVALALSILRLVGRAVGPDPVVWAAIGGLFVLAAVAWAYLTWLDRRIEAGP